MRLLDDFLSHGAAALMRWGIAALNYHAPLITQVALPPAPQHTDPRVAA